MMVLRLCLATCVQIDVQGVCIVLLFTMNCSFDVPGLYLIEAKQIKELDERGTQYITNCIGELPKSQ